MIISNNNNRNLLFIFEIKTINRMILFFYIYVAALQRDDFFM